MQVRHLSLIILTSLGLSVAFSSASLAGVTTITLPGGRSATLQNTFQRTGNGFNRQTTLTGHSGTTLLDVSHLGDTSTRTLTLPDGKTASSTGSLTKDANGNYTDQVTRTNRQGVTQTYQIDGQHSQSNGTRQGSITITDPNGQQGTINRSATRSNGQYTENSTATFPNGKTREVNVSTNTLGSGTSAGTVNITEPNGQTRTITFDRQR